MFERFTEKAIKVIMLAQEEARRLGHNFVGTEQILLGLIGEGTGVAAKVLKSLGVNLKDSRIEVEKIIGVYVVQILIDEAHLNYFSIKQKYRQKGYGSYLMGYLIKQCEKLSIKKILLEVSDTNSIAEVFYNKFKFLNVGRRKNYYKNGSDAILKEKIL